MLALLLVMAGVHYLRLRSERTGTALARIVANIASISVASIFFAGFYAVLCVLAGLLVSLLVPWLRESLPSGLGGYLVGLDREPGLFYIAAVIAVIVAITAVSAFGYRRFRKRDDLAQSLEPSFNIVWLFGLFVFLVLMLMFDAMLIGIGANAFGFTGSGDWLRNHFGRAVGYGFVATLGVVCSLYVYRRRRAPDWETKGQTLLRVTHSVWVALLVAGGSGLVAMIAIAALKGSGTS
jgi:hypothetical protein